MLNEKLFCKLLRWAIEQEQKQEKLAKALQDYADDSDLTNFWTHNSDFVVEFLAEAMYDEGEWISWWMWEAKHGTAKTSLCTVTEGDGRKWVLTTPEKLYEFLVSNHSASESKEGIAVQSKDTKLGEKDV